MSPRSPCVFVAGVPRHGTTSIVLAMNHGVVARTAAAERDKRYSRAEAVRALLSIGVVRPIARSLRNAFPALLCGVLASQPIAALLCDASCSASQPHATHAEQHCHGTSPSGTNTGDSPDSSGCDHHHGLLTGNNNASGGSLGPAVATVLLPVQLVAVATIQPRSRGSVRSVTHDPPLVLPLRI